MAIWRDEEESSVADGARERKKTLKGDGKTTTTTIATTTVTVPCEKSKSREKKRKEKKNYKAIDEQI